MFEQLLARLKSLLPDPARTGLGWWLMAIQLAIVLLVAAGITWYASGMLHDLADQQGKARVQLAATTAREDLRRIGEDAHATARALATVRRCSACSPRGRARRCRRSCATGAKPSGWMPARCSPARP
jgi:hypothetical protein